MRVKKNKDITLNGGVDELLDLSRKVEVSRPRSKSAEMVPSYVNHLNDNCTSYDYSHKSRNVSDF